MKTYSLPEATGLLCGEATPQAVRWMADQIRARRFSARKVRGHWRMSEADVEFALTVCGNGADHIQSGPRVLSFSPTSARKQRAS